jgi:hypothetical protein
LTGDSRSVAGDHQRRRTAPVPGHGGTAHPVRGGAGRQGGRRDERQAAAGHGAADARSDRQGSGRHPRVQRVAARGEPGRTRDLVDLSRQRGRHPHGPVHHPLDLREGAAGPAGPAHHTPTPHPQRLWRSDGGRVGAVGGDELERTPRPGVPRTHRPPPHRPRHPRRSHPGGPPRPGRPGQRGRGPGPWTTENGSPPPRPGG